MEIKSIVTSVGCLQVLCLGYFEVTWHVFFHTTSFGFTVLRSLKLLRVFKSTRYTYDVVFVSGYLFVCWWLIWESRITHEVVNPNEFLEWIVYVQILDVSSQSDPVTSQQHEIHRVAAVTDLSLYHHLLASRHATLWWTVRPCH